METLVNLIEVGAPVKEPDASINEESNQSHPRESRESGTAEATQEPKVALESKGNQIIKDF